MKKKYCIHFQPNKTLTNFFPFQHSKKRVFYFLCDFDREWQTVDEEKR